MNNKDINGCILEEGLSVTYIRTSSYISEPIRPYLSKGTIKSVGTTQCVISDYDSSVHTVFHNQLIVNELNEDTYGEF